MKLTGEQLRQRFPAFGMHLGPQDADALAGALDARVVAAGQTLVAEGQEGHGLYLAWSARLAVSVEAHEGEMGHVAPGELFGEVSLIDGGPASATVKVSEGGTILHLDSEALARLEHDHSAAAAAVYRAVCDTLARRLRQVTEDFEQRDLGTDLHLDPAATHASGLIGMFRSMLGIS